MSEPNAATATEYDIAEANLDALAGQGSKQAEADVFAAAGPLGTSSGDHHGGELDTFEDSDVNAVSFTDLLDFGQNLDAGEDLDQQAETRKRKFPAFDMLPSPEVTPRGGIDFHPTPGGHQAGDLLPHDDYYLFGGAPAHDYYSGGGKAGQGGGGSPAHWYGDLSPTQAYEQPDFSPAQSSIGHVMTPGSRSPAPELSSGHGARHGGKADVASYQVARVYDPMAGKEVPRQPQGAGEMYHPGLAYGQTQVFKGAQPGYGSHFQFGPHAGKGGGGERGHALGARGGYRYAASPHYGAYDPRPGAPPRDPEPIHKGYVVGPHESLFLPRTQVPAGQGGAPRVTTIADIVAGKKLQRQTASNKKEKAATTSARPSSSKPSSKVSDDTNEQPAKRAQNRSSKFRGVTRHRRSGRWEAHIWVRETGRQVYLGGYELEDHAAEAYDVAALKCKGKKVKTNFDIARYAELMQYMDTISLEELVMAVRRQSQGFARGSSKYRGVTRHPNGRWESRIGMPGSRHIYLGLYNDEAEAARAYDRALVKIRGTAAATNFSLTDYTEELKEYHMRQQQEILGRQGKSLAAAATAKGGKPAVGGKALGVAAGKDVGSSGASGPGKVAAASGGQAAEGNVNTQLIACGSDIIAGHATRCI